MTKWYKEFFCGVANRYWDGALSGCNNPVLDMESGKIEISALELDTPDILLETDRTGRPNWEFAPAEGKAASSAAAASRVRPAGM